MANLYDLTDPLNDVTLKVLRGDPQKPLESLQGNILQGHGRERSVQIFLHFNRDEQEAVKQWIHGTGSSYYLRPTTIR